MTQKERARARAELREAARFFPAARTLVAAAERLMTGSLTQVSKDQWEILHLAAGLARGRRHA